MSFLLLYLSFLLDSLHRLHDSHAFWISTQIPDLDFKKIITLVQKRTLPFVTNT